MCMTRKWRLPILAAIGVVLLAAPGLADQFWIAYEGNDYPENQGWVREYGNENGPYAGGATRSLADGIFTVDSLSSIDIYDFYQTNRTIDPGPGELFVAEWRVLIDSRSDPYDVDVGIFRALSPGYVALKLASNALYVQPGGITIALEEGVFHSYRFESASMYSYRLSIDDAIVLNGYLEDFTLLQYSVAFGDGVQGYRSLSHWDYFRYGIVPEPAAVGSVLWLLLCPLLRRTSRGVAVT